MVDELLSLTQPSAKRNTTANLIWLTFWKISNSASNEPSLKSWDAYIAFVI